MPDHNPYAKQLVIKRLKGSAANELALHNAEGEVIPGVSKVEVLSSPTELPWVRVTFIANGNPDSSIKLDIKD